MRKLTLSILFILSFSLLAQHKAIPSKELLPSHSKLPNYDYVESFPKESKGNLALLIHNMHISLMAFNNGDSTKISNPVIFVDGKYMPIQSLTEYNKSNIEKIEVEFMSHNILLAMYGSSALNGYGVIRIQLKKQE